MEISKRQDGVILWREDPSREAPHNRRPVLLSTYVKALETALEFSADSSAPDRVLASCPEGSAEEWDSPNEVERRMAELIAPRYIISVDPPDVDSHLAMLLKHVRESIQQSVPVFHTIMPTAIGDVTFEYVRESDDDFVAGMPYTDEAFARYLAWLDHQIFLATGKHIIPPAPTEGDT